MVMIRSNFYPEYMISKYLLLISIWNSKMLMRVVIVLAIEWWSKKIQTRFELNYKTYLSLYQLPVYYIIWKILTCEIGTDDFPQNVGTVYTFSALPKRQHAGCRGVWWCRQSVQLSALSCGAVMCHRSPSSVVLAGPLEPFLCSRELLRASTGGAEAAAGAAAASCKDHPPLPLQSITWRAQAVETDGAPLPAVPSLGTCRVWWKSGFQCWELQFTPLQRAGARPLPHGRATSVLLWWPTCKFKCCWGTDFTHKIINGFH